MHALGVHAAHPHCSYPFDISTNPDHEYHMCMQWAGMAPTIRGTWGHGIQIIRLNMYLHTTPAMVYLLSIISDFSRAKVIVCQRGLGFRV